MPLLQQNLGVHAVRANHFYFGAGIFAGRAPDPEVPDSPDGRFRKLNQPARGRIVLLDRGSLRIVASTLSEEDGTWSIERLNESLFYMVLGLDDSGQQNAAIQDWVKPYVPE